MNCEWKNIPIAGNKSYEELAASDLEELAKKYPYSFLHQFLFAKKVSQIDETAYRKQVPKAALLTNNIPWLQFILYNNSEITTHTNTFEKTIEERVNNASPVFEEPDEMGEVIETENELYLANERNEDVNGSLVSSILDREKEIAEEKNELNYEPLHTVDYFASQGIKTVSEKLPNDKLSKQLKSFTEWLKMMKRLPVEETTVISEIEEQKIQTSAEDSNEVKDVITEAMAEVLVKQGKMEKAKNIYHKLSLLYPEKSPYFATKIEQLNG
ncbi:MAG TPA: hypothetical protein VFN30_04035 [Chitinophagaceae bacterium]|nr:hypothetical protein [Chitinophagaceae bacterium]